MEADQTPPLSESIPPSVAELLDAADTEEERGNFESASTLRERARTITYKPMTCSIHNYAKPDCLNCYKANQPRPIQQSTVNLLLRLQEPNVPQLEKARLLQDAIDNQK